MIPVLALTGCQSGFFGPCGTTGCGPTGGCGTLRSIRDRVFRPRTTYIGASPGVSSAPVVDYGSPGLISPAPMSSGTISSGTISGPGLAPMVVPGSSSVSPSGPIEAPPAQLDPIEKAPSAVPGPVMEPNTGAKSSTGKVNYEASRSKYRTARPRNDAIARAQAAAPEPTRLSARGGAPEPAQVNPLDNLPPLDLPREVTGQSGGMPDPPPAEEEAEANPAPVSDVRKTELTSAVAPAPAELNVTPGIRNFLSVENRLAGGSLPNEAGLDWLAEKGYMTVLDLRESNTEQPTFPFEVTKRGMRYVALPVGLKTLDKEHLARFRFELSLAEARPLYFCDTDGTRAGLLWYIRQMTSDHADPQAANREAEELGLKDKASWIAASAYLQSLKPIPPPTLPRVPEPPLKPKAEKSKQAVSTEASVDSVLDIARTPDDHETGRAGPALDPTAWRPLVALLLTALGIPLAFLGRSALPMVRSWTRASLPAPARRPRSLPSASGE